MFNSIWGKISEKSPEGIFLLSGSIEWDITVPARDLAQLPALGEECRIFTWLNHREDQMKLFGFAKEERRAAFLELLKVEGIGPKGAIKILGGIGQEELEQALETEDIERLEAVPGLGKKTAQKMMLALRGKLVKPKAEGKTPYGELLEALTEMGYDKRSATEALERAEKELPSGTVAAEKEKLLFKQAIVYLSGT